MKKILALFCVLFIGAAIAFGYTIAHYKEKSSHRFLVKIPIDAALFQEKLAKEPPEWMRKQIHLDLSAYEKTGITKEMLDAFFQGKAVRDFRLIRFTIKDRQLSFSLTENNLDFRPFRHVLAAINKLNELTPLPDLDFLMSLEDGFSGDVGAPLFVFAKANTASSLILMPDFKALTGYPRLRAEMKKGSQKWSWENKISKAFWRGSTTGGWLTAQNWDQIPRVKLALLGHDHPEKIDAGITGVVQCDADVPKRIQSKGLMSNMVKQADHLKYKYLVDVDGNSCSFERYFWALLSNSLVFKQLTPNIQWYYGGLKPYEHFIPVKVDLSDLLEQIEWAKTHEPEAKQIAANATHFVETELLPEDIFIYMTHLLREYAIRQAR